MNARKSYKIVGLVVSMGLSLSIMTMAYGQEKDELMLRRGAQPDEIMSNLRSIRRPVTDSKPNALGVRLYFDYNSAELTPETKKELTNYGKSLASDEFKGAHWAIEGHTDASGSAAYNQSLSERRAQSVYNYLIKEFNIDPDQLVPEGKGESELYDPDKPQSGVNRRVRIKYLGG